MNKKRIFSYCIVILMLCFVTSLMAQTQKSASDIFDVDRANKQFDELSIKLSIQNLKVDDLSNAVQKLETLQGQANDCVEKAQEQLKEIDTLLAATKADLPIKQKAIDSKYLEEKKIFHAKQAAECRVFVFRSQEAIIAFKKTIQKLSTTKILQQGTPVWKVFEKPTILSFTLDSKKLYQLSGLEKLMAVNLVILLILVACGLGLSVFIRAGCNRWLRTQAEKHSITITLVRMTRMFVIPLFFFFITSLFLSAIAFGIQPIPSLVAVSYAFMIYTLVLFIISFLLFLPVFEDIKLQLSPALGKVIFKRIIVIATLLLLGYATRTIFREQQFTLQLIELVRTVYITLLSVAVVWLCWIIEHLPVFEEDKGRVGLISKIILSTFLIIMIVTEWVGYHELSVFLIKGIFLSFLIITIAWISIQLMEGGFRVVEDRQYLIARKIRYFLGLPIRRNINELILIRIALYAMILATLILFLLKTWSVSAVHIDQLQKGLMSGFKFSGLTIIPSRIVMALILFSVIFILGRIVAAYAAHLHQFEGERDSQVAIASIIRYVGFALALLVALLIAGINFTGLAIIAGALSVGIGFGLQNIANNFASGVILLLQRPVKPGDRVVIGDTEGFVKKIRLLSTQISTLAKEDVIVPNSDLITHPITNYMFRDRLGRVTCQVGVTYGSDIELVKQVLLDVASQHPDVIQESPNLPVVLFRTFGDNSLNFELWCFINDVNKRYRTTSDLNFAIDHAFRKNNIVIAFPQRDLHIKSMPPDLQKRSE